MTPATIEAPTILVPPRTAILDLAARWDVASRDLGVFQSEFCWTNKVIPGRDGGRATNVETLFPADRPHLQALNALWLDNPLLAIVKCRQVLLTWWMATIALWDAAFHKGRLIMQQAKRLEDVIGDETTGDGLLGRTKYILARIPCARDLGLTVDAKADRLVFPRSRSTIWAIPQGGSILRQRTASGIESDEAAFQPEFGDALTAAIPCIRSGGWFVAVSTADLTDGGAMFRLVRDLPDE
jgi:hypothetical protein